MTDSRICPKTRLAILPAAMSAAAPAMLRAGLLARGDAPDSLIVPDQPA
jgi:hypothetical protein